MDKQEIDKSKKYDVSFQINEKNKDIFELLKKIKHVDTNNELRGYFKFTKFYGLLDPKNSKILDTVEEKHNKLSRICLGGSAITFLFVHYFYKRNYVNLALAGMLIGSIPMTYIYYRESNEMNFLLLEMKDDYIYKVDRFFKENKNPNILNPNFMTEDLIDPDLKAYQQLLKSKSMKNI